MDLREIVSARQQKARDFAAEKHEGQFRKGSGEPYAVHPQRVADILESYGASEPVLCAAELHDCVEDTDTEVNDILDLIDSEVAELVSEVTNAPDLDGLEKEVYMSRKLVNLTDDALTIKLGDMLYNLLDKPKPDQVKRMRKNLEYLMEWRDLNELQLELVQAFEMGSAHYH